MEPKKLKRSLHSVGICVLSKDSGTKEEIKEFIQQVKKDFPQYVVEGRDYWDMSSLVIRKLKKLNKENEKENEQLHTNILVIGKDFIPEYDEDAGREETEYFNIYVKLVDEDEQEEIIDRNSECFNNQGTLFRGKDETIKEFVWSLFRA
jgi:hypothetical protein